MPTACDFRPQPSDADGFDEGLESVGAGAQPCDRANVDFALGRPHCAVAIGHFALGNGRSERPFAAVAGEFHQSGIGGSIDEEPQRLADVVERASTGLEGG